MAKLDHENVNDQDAMERTDQSLGDLLSTDEVPSVVCGVQRKANIGRYENIDIHCSIKLPLGVDYAALNTNIESAIAYGFHVTSTETLKRYNKISIYGEDNADVAPTE